ncbi:hypothetical protein SAMN04487936_10741 [Halobacillus dabanensis]|uniref:Uncharacterized protein n=1 Tax=Halobacillus dabanensis TaxID=240302 RepID=A0A1I3WNI5_HALDA|nr:hypothetical protein [Halobacillus dabanensis]SFK08713.1 hypothetical protein SAMN04487936_10741 [Halobacillus dabanensis]
MNHLCNKLKNLCQEWSELHSLSLSLVFFNSPNDFQTAFLRPKTKEIHINKAHLHTDDPFYTLAHEVGHAIDFEKTGRFSQIAASFQEAQSHLTRTNDLEAMRKAYRKHIQWQYEAEVKAWVLAEKLLIRSNLLIDSEAFHKEKELSLASYRFAYPRTYKRMHTAFQMRQAFDHLGYKGSRLRFVTQSNESTQYIAEQDQLIIGCGAVRTRCPEGMRSFQFGIFDALYHKASVIKGDNQSFEREAISLGKEVPSSRLKRKRVRLVFRMRELEKKRRQLVLRQVSVIDSALIAFLDKKKRETEKIIRSYESMWANTTFPKNNSA